MGFIILAIQEFWKHSNSCCAKLVTSQLGKRNRDYTRTQELQAIYLGHNPLSPITLYTAMGRLQCCDHLRLYRWFQHTSCWCWPTIFHRPLFYVSMFFKVGLHYCNHLIPRWLELCDGGMLSRRLLCAWACEPEVEGGSSSILCLLSNRA